MIIFIHHAGSRHSSLTRSSLSQRNQREKSNTTTSPTVNIILYTVHTFNVLVGIICDQIDTRTVHVFFQTNKSTAS